MRRKQNLTSAFGNQKENRGNHAFFRDNKASIGHLHDGVILQQLPEFISFSFSNSNFVIPGESKEQ